MDASHRQGAASGVSTIALVTDRLHPDGAADDLLVAPHLARLGVDLNIELWDDRDVNWSAYDAIVMRSAWDYHNRLGEFRDWLARLQDQRAALWNGPRSQFWNSDKHYLIELQTAGVNVVPTEWLDQQRAVDLGHLLERRGWNKAVIKPCVGASAQDVWICDISTVRRDQQRVMDMLSRSEVMVQPFLREVVRNGEISLVFIAGQFSHAVRSMPGTNDFRVQSGISKAFVPPAELIAQAATVLSHAPEPALYARVDMIQQDGAAVLMELELIEPTLFLMHDAHAPQRFAQAIAAAARFGARLHGPASAPGTLPAA